MEYSGSYEDYIMDRKLFNRMYLGEFVNDGPSDYPELKKENSMSGIYTHECPNCKARFLGYKRRYYCLDCDRKING